MKGFIEFTPFLLSMPFRAHLVETQCLAPLMQRVSTCKSPHTEYTEYPDFFERKWTQMNANFLCIYTKKNTRQNAKILQIHFPILAI